MEKILVTRTSMPSKEEYFKEIEELWESHWLTNMGTKHEKLRSELKNYMNVSELELLVNGHLALELTLQAMNLSGEVITTPFTFASTTHAIVRNGLTPVFCDINPDTYTIDVDKIESLITDKTCAILPVHVYGNICDVERIEEIAQKHGLKVIYDAAHSFGVTYKGQGIGNFGDACMFSFHATKVFNTIEGGAVTYKDNELGKELYTLKNFGIKGEEIVDGVGANAKMNEFQAAMGICNLRHIDKAIARRKELVELYRELLRDVDGIVLQGEQENVKSNYAYFPIVVDADKYGMNRDELVKTFAEHNIIVRKYFYPITSKFQCYGNMYEKYPTPIALDISERVITLPLYPDMSNELVQKICDIIKIC